MCRRGKGGFGGGGCCWPGWGAAGALGFTGAGGAGALGAAPISAFWFGAGSSSRTRYFLPTNASRMFTSICGSSLSRLPLDDCSGWSRLYDMRLCGPYTYSRGPTSRRRTSHPLVPAESTRSTSLSPSADLYFSGRGAPVSSEWTRTYVSFGIGELL